MRKRESPAAALARMRWAKDVVRDQPREAGKHGGRPKSPRCPCGKMTQAAAEKSGHVCEEEENGGA